MLAVLYLALAVLAISIVRRLIRRFVRRVVDRAIDQVDGSDRGLYISVGLAALVVAAILAKGLARTERQTARRDTPAQPAVEPYSITSSETLPGKSRLPSKHSTSDKEWVDRTRTECFMNDEAKCLEIAEAEIEAHRGVASAGAEDYAMACTKERHSGCLGLLRAANGLLENGELRLARVYGEKACDASMGEGCYVAGKAYATNAREMKRPGDKALAIALFKRACTNGFKPACDTRP